MFPSWRYHAVKGARLFQDPDELSKAGSGWAESPADVGLVPEAPKEQGNMLMIPAPVMPTDDESVATPEEAAASAARAARHAQRASSPSSPASRAKALGTERRGRK